MSVLSLSDLAFLNLGPFDLRIEAGECVALTGPSGIGKSLLLRAIADLIPHQGEAWLDEQACSRTSPELWRQQVALLPAESQWWSERIGDHFKAYDETCFSELGGADAHPLNNVPLPIPLHLNRNPTH